MARNTSLTEERRQKVLELVKQGKTQTEIAKELGTATSTIASDVKVLRTSGKLPDKYKEKMKEDKKCLSY